VAGNNDNALVPEISNNRLRIVEKNSATFPPGNYYLSALDVKGTITIEGDPENPVDIWLDGSFKIFPQGELITPSGRPGLRIFSRSSQIVDIQPNQPENIHGMAYVYAPYANVQILPNNDFYGGIWGQQIAINPGIDFYIDLDMIDDFVSNSMRVVARKEIRDFEDLQTVAVP